VRGRRWAGTALGDELDRDAVFFAHMEEQKDVIRALHQAFARQHRGLPLSEYDVEILTAHGLSGLSDDAA